jgi:protein CpxP
MSERHTVTSGDGMLPPRSRRRRRFLAGLVTGGLLAGLFAGGASMYAQAHSRARGWFRAGHSHADPETAGERATFAADWVLHRIDASSEQRQQVQAIVQAAVKDLWPMRDQHHQHRDALRAALAQPTLDHGALEDIRRAELQLADTASSRLLQAIAEAAEVLTPEQRAKLVNFGGRWHR